MIILLQYKTMRTRQYNSCVLDSSEIAFGFSAHLTSNININGSLRSCNNAHYLRLSMVSPHALIIPFPAQGHVIPFIELSYCLVDRGFHITFVNTEFNHNRVVSAMSKGGGQMGRIHLVSVPDGLAPDGDRNNIPGLTESLLISLPVFLEDLIQKRNDSGEKFTYMIADQSLGWILQTAKKMGLRSASFFPASADLLATIFSIPKLIEDKIIDTDGVPLKQDMIQLSPGMPLMNPTHFAWLLIGDLKARQLVFNHIALANEAAVIADFIICNTSFEVEPAVFDYAPNILPVGPLLTGHRIGNPIGNFWPEDATCMEWLDEQPESSVVYVAFGSFTIFDQQQFQELALGLELTGRRFLWVVRPDLTDGANNPYPNGFAKQVAGRGRMVGWAPQQRVLAHPSIACFLTHCGWNSTLEGVMNGIPFICWPYFADQFLNQSYICDIWETGLRITPDESGIVTKEEIKLKLEELLGKDEMKARAQALKEIVDTSVAEGGSSCENFNNFVDAMKEGCV